MTPLPAPLPGSGEIVAWRIDTAVHAAAWDSGEGAYRVGGRWNSRGVRAVYCSIDPATAILEVAVHKGFNTLDTVAHTLTSFVVSDPSLIHVAQPDAISNPAWLASGIPSAGPQSFGDALLAAHKFIAISSAVSKNSWNLIFVAANAAGAYTLRSQERLVIDARLNPVKP